MRIEFLDYICLCLQKKCVGEVKPKTKAFRLLKVEAVYKFDVSDVSKLSIS